MPRSNHFDDAAIDKGFPNHISSDGTAYYNDGTVLRPSTTDEVNRFQFILDVVPQWWKDRTDIQIEISMPIARIPGTEPALPGDWIIREPDGHIRTESCEEGRIKARKFLVQLRREVGL